MTNPILTFIIILFLAGNAQAEMKPIKKLRGGTPPFSVISKIVQSNRLASDKRSQKNTRSRAPILTWLADTDPRLQVSYILDSPQGKVFTVRNTANQLDLSLGAVDLAVLQMHTPILLITSCSDSFSIRYFLEGKEGLSPATINDFSGLVEFLGTQKETTQKKEKQFEDMVIQSVEKNIDHQVTLATSRYEKRIVTGRLAVVGGILDINNHYGRGAGRLIIINVNGETDSGRLRKMQIMTQIPPEMLKVYVGRERHKQRRK